jgi:hydrogenase-4 membrane subunit HyfE
VFQALAFPAVLILALTSLTLLISEDWRASLIALIIQNFAVFFLVAINWPMEMAGAKLVAGIISAAVIWMAVVSQPLARMESQLEEQTSREAAFSRESRMPGAQFLSGRIFRLLTAILVGLTVISIGPQMLDWMRGIRLEQAWGALTLIGMGLLQLGFTSRPFRTVIGLLTVLAGFEILYAVVENSTLVAGLLAAVNLGIALVGAYLLEAPQMDEAG